MSTAIPPLSNFPVPFNPRLSPKSNTLLLLKSTNTKVVANQEASLEIKAPKEETAKLILTQWDHQTLEAFCPNLPTTTTKANSHLTKSSNTTTRVKLQMEKILWLQRKTAIKRQKVAASYQQARRSGSECIWPSRILTLRLMVKVPRLSALAHDTWPQLQHLSFDWQLLTNYVITWAWT